MKPKTCKVCKTKFQPVRPIQPCCGYECSVTYGIAVASKNAARKARNEAKAHREAKVKAKTKAQWTREAQAAVNKVRRLEDQSKGYPCISCGRHHKGQYHAGHYRSTKAAPELRFEPRNIHLQCQPCNTHLSGNIIEYRKGLIARYGVEEVEWLEGPHDPKHYTIDDLKAIKKEYTDRLKNDRTA